MFLANLYGSNTSPLFHISSDALGVIFTIILRLFLRTKLDWQGERRRGEEEEEGEEVRRGEERRDCDQNNAQN